MGNHNVQLIGVEDRTPEQKLNVVTQTRLATDGVKSDSAKTSTTEWVRKSTAKSPTFDLQKEK